MISERGQAGKVVTTRQLSPKYNRSLWWGQVSIRALLSRCRGKVWRGEEVWVSHR